MGRCEDSGLKEVVLEEDYLRDMILSCDDMESEEIAEKVIEEIKGISGNRLKDDATIIVGKLVKSL